MKRLNFKKVTCLAGMLILSLLLSACCPKIRVYEKDVEPMVKAEMERKYGIDVDILDIEFGSGRNPGVPTFGAGYYYVDASYDDKEFSVTVDNCSKEITDNYAKYLIGESIEEKVQAGLVNIYLYLDGDDLDVIANDIHKALKESEDEGIQYIIDCEYKGETIHFSCFGSVPLETTEEIRQKLSEVE